MAGESTTNPLGMFDDQLQVIGEYERAMKRVSPQNVEVKDYEIVIRARHGDFGFPQILRGSLGSSGIGYSIIPMNNANAWVPGDYQLFLNDGDIQHPIIIDYLTAQQAVEFGEHFLARNAEKRQPREYSNADVSSFFEMAEAQS